MSRRFPVIGSVKRAAVLVTAAAAVIWINSAAASRWHGSAVDPNADVVVGFSPGVGGYRAEDVVLQAINECTSTIRMAAYSFTSKPIAEALVAARRRGVDVKVVVDQKENGKRYTAATFIANEGIPTRTDDKYKILHDKFLVCNNASVETGSFNYTASAAHENAENALLLRRVPNLAAQYTQEWNRLWNESNELAPRY